MIYITDKARASRQLLWALLLFLAACGGGGGGGGSTTSTPSTVAPMISYGATSFTLTTQLPASLVATNSGGAVVTWSISPALPAGLAFSTTDGTISGTPTATAAAATYTVTAQNAGGMATVGLSLTVESGVLLDLGHANVIQAISVTSSRALTLDRSMHWVLWDYASATNLANGSASCASQGCSNLAGDLFVIETSTGLQVRSATDGSLSASITAPFTWWKLASDGSYVTTGSPSGLAVWSPTGSMIASRAGDYSSAVAFAAPGEVQVALGPAGANVIETVTLPGAASSVSAQFEGQFNSWFLDGQSFLTSSGNTVWVYSNAAVQQSITAAASVQNLTGQGNWFWTLPDDSPLSIYPATGGSPVTYSFTGGATAFGSALTIGVFDGAGGVHVIDLSGATPAKTDYSPLLNQFTAYGAFSSSQWLTGNAWGVVTDGASLAATPRYFGYGTAWSIAGSTERAVIATASGAILSFNASSQALEATINFLASQVELSSDGSVLAAGYKSAALYADYPDWSIQIYSLPAATVSYTFPYTSQDPQQAGETLPFEMTLSGSGTVIGQGLEVYAGVVPTGSWSCSRQVTAVSGGAPTWSQSLGQNCIIGPFEIRNDGFRITADGTLIAVSSSKDQDASTNIYSNSDGALLTAVPGWAATWLDSSHILLNNYTLLTGTDLVYTGSTVYNSSGNETSAPALPELGRGDPVQVLSADSLYDPYLNSIYSVSTGQATWTSPSPSTGIGAVAGSGVVFASQNLVLIQPL